MAGKTTKTTRARGFVIQKDEEGRPPKDIRLTIPGDIWAAIESVAAKFEVEPQLVIRQAIERSLKVEVAAVRKASRK